MQTAKSAKSGKVRQKSGKKEKKDRPGNAFQADPSDDYDLRKKLSRTFMISCIWENLWEKLSQALIIS